MPVWEYVSIPPAPTAAVVPHQQLQLLLVLHVASGLADLDAPVPLQCILAATWHLPHVSTDACNGHLPAFAVLLLAAGAAAEPSAFRLPLGEGGDETLLVSMPERPFSALAKLPGDLVSSLLAQTGKGRQQVFGQGQHVRPGQQFACTGREGTAAGVWTGATRVFSLEQEQDLEQEQEFQDCLVSCMAYAAN